MSQTRVKRIIAKLNEKAANVMRQLMESDASKGRKVLTEKLEKAEATVATLQLEKDGMKTQLEVEKHKVSAQAVELDQLELKVENLTAEVAQVSNEALIGATARIDGLMEQLTSALEQKGAVEKQRDEVVKDLTEARATIAGFGAVEQVAHIGATADYEEQPLGHIPPPKLDE